MTKSIAMSFRLCYTAIKEVIVIKLHEKLDMLMKIADVNNSKLGKITSFDASYISRVRSGKRSIQKNQHFVSLVSAFFAKSIQDSYKTKLLEDLICPGTEWPKDEKTAEALIFAFLSHENAEDNPVEKILTGISSMPPCKPLFSKMELQKPEIPDTGFYYGNEGKRQAVAAFLSELCTVTPIPSLCLSSTEEFDWMYEDKNYAKKWAMLMFQYLQKGGHIKIIHSINRGAGDMLVALQKWMPLYMTGAIEPYYYPKLRDRVSRRTVFIAENYAAVFSYSVGTHTEGNLNVLLHDKNAVRALQGEFNDYFAMCKPLMQIFSCKNRTHFYEMLQEFDSRQEEMIMALPTPTFVTMPQTVIDSMTARCGNDWLQMRHDNAFRRFQEQLESGKTVTEIIHLPKAETVLAGKLMFPMCDLFDRPGLYYTAEEFRLHLESMMHCLETYENYRVVLSSEIPENEIVYVKDDVGAIVVKAETPSVAFGIGEQRMTSAFFAYLTAIRDSGDSKKKVLQALKNYIENLK